MAVFLFLVAAAAKGRSEWKRVLFPFLSLAGLAAAGLHLYACGAEVETGRSLFFGLLASDPLSVFFRILVMAASVICIFISMGSPSLPSGRTGEYHGLLLVMTMGMCLLAASNHLLMMYVAIETVSLCSYLLTGWDDQTRRSREAGLKYVLFGGVASGIMLFGMSLVYGLLGSLSLQDLNAALTASVSLELGTGRLALITGLVFVMGGLGYKIAAVPFHMWCPDVYEGAPTPFTALLSVAPKAVGFCILMRFFYGLFLVPGSMETTLAVSKAIPWVLIIGIISAVTMTVGNFAALVQNNLKRLLAYSSIAHAGYILMGVTAGGKAGFEAVAVYLAVYVVMNMGAFAVVAAVSRKSGSEDIGVFRELGKREPFLAVLMVVFLISLTGLPPTAGFIGKLYLFKALIQHGGYWFMVLAVVGIFNSVISLYYYARVMRAMYFEKAEEELQAVPGSAAGPAAGVALVLAVLTMFLGIFWQSLAQAAQWSAAMFH
jgi:NADH-quinone oxidoreductase subunit N